MRSFRATRLARNDKRTAKVKFANLDALEFNTRAWADQRGLVHNNKNALTNDPVPAQNWQLHPYSVCRFGSMGIGA